MDWLHRRHRTRPVLAMLSITINSSFGLAFVAVFLRGCGDVAVATDSCCALAIQMTGVEPTTFPTRSRVRFSGPIAILILLELLLETRAPRASSM